jgi:hypothetical protein
MATGARPFDGKTTAAMFAAILEKDPPRPISLNGEIPPKLEEIIMFMSSSPCHHN